MMLTVQIIVSFVAGGIFIALQTLIAERVPVAWRGIILSAPSTLALGLLFIGLTKTTNDVVQSTVVVPIALGIDYVFVAIVVLLAKKGLSISMLCGYIFWALGAYVILRFQSNNFFTSCIYGIAMTIISFASIRSVSSPIHLKKFPMNAKHISIRSLIGGTVIALAVFLSHTLGNIWGGLFSAFPAAFSSAFIIYFIMQGREVIPVVGKSLFFPGMIGLILYAGVAASSFPLVGVWLGTLAAYLLTGVYFWGWNRIVKSLVPNN